MIFNDVIYISYCGAIELSDVIVILVLAAHSLYCGDLPSVIFTEFGIYLGYSSSEYII